MLVGQRSELEENEEKKRWCRWRGKETDEDDEEEENGDAEEEEKKRRELVPGKRKKEEGKERKRKIRKGWEEMNGLETSTYPKKGIKIMKYP